MSGPIIPILGKPEEEVEKYEELIKDANTEYNRTIEPIRRHIILTQISRLNRELEQRKILRNQYRMDQMRDAFARGEFRPGNRRRLE